MTYFHIRMYTIIGAKSFHCPVRDGKEWDQLAMVVRQTGGRTAMLCCLPCLLFVAKDLTLIQRTIFLEEVKMCFDCIASHYKQLNVIGSSLTSN